MSRAWLLWLVCVAGCHESATVSCPTLSCLVSCESGTRKDDNTGCDTCLCNGAAAPDGGAACPALECGETCGLGQAVDPLTGCPVCSCCNPADCQPGGCHGTGADGCPTCGPC